MSKLSEYTIKLECRIDPKFIKQMEQLQANPEMQEKIQEVALSAFKKLENAAFQGSLQDAFRRPTQNNERPPADMCRAHRIDWTAGLGHFSMERSWTRYAAAIEQEQPEEVEPDSVFYPRPAWVPTEIEKE